jgi:fatty-acyl-CoA synthase
VGEICRVAPDTALFQGYFDNPDANSSKYRDGVYHSGDLGHILVRDGIRYLFFDGRTDDWIRKDGENFSALQVARLIQEHDDIVLAAAYGVPCAVSDELVMVALKLRAGATFDPKTFFDFCEHQVRAGGMDRKWFPDFVRIVDEFEYTQTEKILVRNLKKVHFDRKRLPDAPLFFRTRGDTAYRPLTGADYEGLRKEFAAAEKLDLLDR